MSDILLVLNAGSSSIKFAVFAAGAEPSRAGLVCEGACDGIGHQIHFTAQDGGGAPLVDRVLDDGATHADALDALLAWIEAAFKGQNLIAVAHRVVHGGALYAEPMLIDEAVVAQLQKLVPLAPLHQPHHLAAIAAISRLYPNLPQIACFDTAFHHGQDRLATHFALPRALTEEGVRRYGFHGLSYDYIASVLPGHLGPAAEGRVIVAHLGSGASLCAMMGRKSVATTMGFTALEGLMMSRRCGALDPGVVLYLMQEKGLGADQISDMLYQRSGLLGVSGLSDDMRTLLASEEANAAEAVDLFVYRIAREIGSLAAALGGLDALVFTAGIGEHAPEIRRRVCDQAAWLGVVLDHDANLAGGPRISTAAAKTSAWVIPTDEDLMIARHAWDFLRTA